LKEKKRYVGDFKLLTKRKGSWIRVRKIIEKATIILIVLDSRNPLGTYNIELERMAKKFHTFFMLVLNKSDLIPKNIINKWMNFFKSRGYSIISINAHKAKDIEILKKKIKHISGKRQIILAIVGYPNVGKSTIINNLKGRKIAGTSPIPGFTKGEKIVKIEDNFLIIDTPGLISSKKYSSTELVFQGGLSPDKIKNSIPAAVTLLKRISNSMPTLLKEYYGINEMEPYDFLKMFAAKRGFILKGGELNVDESARTILRDWQSGKIKFYILPDNEKTIENK
jgi:ribosome biogenesis GTPase A